MDKDNEQFEEWAKPRGYNLMANAHGYIFQSTQSAFESWGASQPEIDELKAEIERLRKDAERYQWLRAQHWNEANIAVVRHPKRSVKLGFDCPNLHRLDEYIDSAMKDTK